MNALTQLGFSSAPLLTVIQAGDFASLSDLAAKAGRDKRNITRDLATLKEAGLVARTEPTKPALTPAGVDQLAALDRANAPTVLHHQIERDPLNPRRVFHPEPLQALAESIWDNGKLTVLQPLVIRPRDGAPIPFRLVAGERRHRAIELLIKDGRWPADMPVPTSIRILSDEEAAVLALVENMQREDLSAVDEALTFEHLKSSLDWSNADIAQHIKRTPEYVQQRLRVLGLPAEVQDRMRLPKTDENRIGFKEARKLFTVSKTPERPKAPQLSPKLALALLELADKIEAAPMTLNGEVGFTVLSQRPTGGALATLNERKIVVLREWAGQVFAKIQLYTSGAVTYLEDSGFYGPKRTEVIWAARTAIMAPQRASEATRGGRYITPELNTEVVAEEAIEAAEEPVPEETEQLPPFERFTSAVREAAIDAAAEAEGGARHQNAKVSGTTTSEGETWPEAPTEILNTPWKGAPIAEIRLTVSSAGRWHACLSTQQGGPGYAGQGDAFGVWTCDPLFAHRGDAIRYAIARIKKQLGEWGDKRAIRSWFGDLLTTTPATPQANPVRLEALGTEKPRPAPRAKDVYEIACEHANEVLEQVTDQLYHGTSFTELLALTGIKLPLRIAGGLEQGVIYDADDREVLTVDGAGEAPDALVAARALLIATAIEDAADYVEIAPDFKPSQPGDRAAMRRSIRPDSITCLEDGRRFRGGLKRHLLTAHNLSWAEYLAKWQLPNDYPAIAPALQEARDVMARNIAGAAARGAR